MLKLYMWYDINYLNMPRKKTGRGQNLNNGYLWVPGLCRLILKITL